jgi:D-alanyl-D-alanine carboxypeptidase
MSPKYKFPKALENTKRGILTILIIGSFVSNIVLFRELLLKNQNLSEEIEKQMAISAILQNHLVMERNKSSDLQNNLKVEKENNDLIKSQVETISSSVNVLEKLSKTDSVLLKKYSKVYFLNENYAPQKLSDIDSKYLIQTNRTTQIHSDVWPHLQKMMDDANSTGLDLKVLSAYRSFNEQASLKSAYTTSYGSGANKFSADQGYSEHQLGTTLDFNTTKRSSVLSGFDKTPEYKWLTENAYKYGFVISYPKENKYYIYEPWHWRFVGISLATRIHDDNTYLYALDQRDIDTYLINLFD